MTVSTLHAYKTATNTLAATDLPGILDGIYAMGTAGTWWDGTTRTPGSGSAWTWTRYQNGGVTEAVYAVPPYRPGAIYQMIMFAGAKSGSHPNVAMKSGSTFALGQLLIGLWTGTGAPTFSAWDAATPITGTGGYWLGYHVAANPGTGASSSFDKAELYETEETVWCIPRTATQNWLCNGGALINPVSSATSDAESDGRIYAVGGLGTTAPMVAAFLDGAYTSTGRILGWHTTGNHTVQQWSAKTPGASSSTNIQLYLAGAAVASNRSLSSTLGKTLSGRHGCWPMECTKHTSVGLGWWRDAYGTAGGSVHQPYTDGSNTVFVIGPSLTVSGDALVLRRA